MKIFAPFLTEFANSASFDTTETESGAHRTLALKPTHWGPEYTLYYEGFF